MMRALLIAVLLCVAIAARAEIRVVDDAGDTLVLPAPAQRIVAIAPHLVELLFAAGAGDRVIAVSEHSDHPEAARRLPRIGDAVLLDLERVVALKPDLVVVWGNGSSPQQVRRLRAAGLPVFASEGRGLAHIAATLRLFGRLAGTEAAAEARAAAFEQRLQALRATYAGRRPIRVFHQIWHAPLMTVNGRHPVSEALALCGAVNVFAGLAPLVPQVDAEAVIAARPEAIVTGRAAAASSDGLDRWRALPSMRGTALISVDPDLLHRATDRMAEGAQELCIKLDALRTPGKPHTPNGAGAPR